MKVPAAWRSGCRGDACAWRIVRDVMKLNVDPRNFRVFGPDENASNRWNAVLRSRAVVRRRRILTTDDTYRPDGRVMEMFERASVPGLA